MDLNLEELIHINGMAADVAKLKAELDAKNKELEAMTKECDEWKQRAMMSENNSTTMMIENMYLKFILLRKDKVRDFFSHVDPLNQSMLLAFIIKSLPENTPKDVFESVRNMLEVKVSPTSTVIQHADQVIGMNKGEVKHTNNEES